jgi:hypothetical protein
MEADDTLTNRRAVFALLVALAAVGCKPVSEAKAQSFATARFNKICTDFSYQRSSFLGPLKTTVGNTAFAYEWHTKDTDGLSRNGFRIYGVLVEVTPDGDTEVSFLDRPIK